MSCRLLQWMWEYAQFGLLPFLCTRLPPLLLRVIFLCVCLDIKVYISQPSPPATAIPSICFNCSWDFTRAILRLAYVDNVQTALGSQSLDPQPRVCRHTHTGQRVRSARVTKTRASPSSHCDASVTLNCTPVCNHGLKPPLSTDLRLVHVSMPRKITLCTQFN